MIALTKKLVNFNERTSEIKWMGEVVSYAGVHTT